MFTWVDCIDSRSCPDYDNQADNQDDRQSNPATAEAMGKLADTVLDITHNLFDVHFGLPWSTAGLIHIRMFLLPSLFFMASTKLTPNALLFLGQFRFYHFKNV